MFNIIIKVINKNNYTINLQKLMPKIYNMNLAFLYATLVGEYKNIIAIVKNKYEIKAIFLTAFINLCFKNCFI